MPPKTNPRKLNPLQLRTLTLLQFIARIPDAAKEGPGAGEITILSLPEAHGDHFHLGDAVVSGKDATGLYNENVWHALERKGVSAEMSLVQLDEEPRFNSTLHQMLKQDFGLTIPGLDEPLQEEAGIAVARVLELVRQGVRELPGFEATTWHGLVAPAGTPPQIISTLNKAIADTLKDPDIQHKLAGLGIDIAPDTPAQFAAYIKAEIPKWAAVIKASGAKME